MKRSPKNPPPVKPPAYFRIGQAVRIVAPPRDSEGRSPATPSALYYHGRVGVVSGTELSKGMLFYSIALWSSTRVALVAAELEALTAADHCGMPGHTNACQPRPRDGHCVWCERELPIGTVRTVLDGK